MKIDEVLLCVYVCVCSGTAIRAPFTSPFHSPLLSSCLVYTAAFLSENAAFMSKSRRALLELDRNPVARGYFIIQAPGAFESPYLRDTNE